MKKILPLILSLIISPCILYAQHVSFYFPFPATMPANNSIWKDTLISLKVTVAVPGSITSVTATAGGRQTALSYSTYGYYEGNLSLQGLEGDTMTLKISATDDQNNAGDTAITFIYRPKNDPGITLMMDSLVDFSVARPVLKLNAKCISSAGRGLIEVYTHGNVLEELIASARDSLPVVDLAGYEGTSMQLKLLVTDDIGRTTEKVISVFVESSPYLTEYLKVNGKIMDFRYNKAIVMDRATRYLFIEDAATGQQASPVFQFPFSDKEGLDKAFITPYGAIFSSRETSNGIYEWNNGQLSLVGKGGTLSASGKYAAWTRVRRDLSTGINDTIALATGEVNVSEDGTLVFTRNTGRETNYVLKYKNGQITVISDTNSVYQSPVTDGTNCMYGRYYVPPDFNALYLHNGKMKFLLATENFGNYQLNNRYAAFIKDNQAYRRDTAGNIRQLTFFNPALPCEIDLLNPKGELIVAATGRFFIDKNGESKRITDFAIKKPWNDGILSTAFYDNDNWYIAIGNTLFKVNLDIPPIHITDIEKSVQRDSLLTFTAKDFTDRFTGPGRLSAVTFTALPKHGALYVGGWNTAIPLSFLAQLNYTPDSAYTGRDTIRWVATNGFEYTDTAAIYINVVADTAVTVPQPVVNGLNSAYCNALGSRQVKIANLPPAAAGISVKVLLDSAVVLQVAADSTFTIQPATLAVGKHTVEVSFMRDTVQKQWTQSFTVQPAVMPVVDVTVNVNPVIDTTLVIITAVNVTGGGKLPFYTFARDRDFIDVLQIEGSNNSAVVSPAIFKLGDNMVYVRMRTSENCYTSQTATDSINIIKTAITAIDDVDFPNQGIYVYPNPFLGQINIGGLQLNRTYIVSLYNMQSSLILQKRIVNSTKVQLNIPAINNGPYLLNVYDEKRGKMLGTKKLLKY